MFIVVLCFVLLGQGHIGIKTKWHRLSSTWNVSPYNNVLYCIVLTQQPLGYKSGEVLGSETEVLG